MQLKQRWHRFLYLLTRRVWQKEDRWVPGIDVLKQLLHYLPRVIPWLEKDVSWKNVRIVSQWRTIDGLLQHITIATAIIEHCGDVIEPGKLLMAEPSEYRLYDYFLTEARIPVGLQEVVNTFCDKVARFLNALETVEQKDSYRHRYYMRRYFRLVEASHTFAQVLCDLATRE